MTTNYHERNHWVGTDAEMALCTPVNPGAIWFQTNTLDSYWWDGTVWVAMGGGGAPSCFVCDIENTYGGDGALVNHTSGNYNTAVGYDASHEDTSGSYNTAVGYDALYYNKTNGENTAIGEEALYNYQGIFWPSRLNVAIGSMAMYDLETGKGNIGIGAHFGNYCGEVNIFIGLDAGDGTNTVDNVAIGHGSLDMANYVCGYANVAVGNNTLAYLDAQGGYITQFSDYSGTVPGTVQVTSNGHGLPGGVTPLIRIYGTGLNYDGTYSVTQIDANNFYFTHAWISDVCTLYNFGYPVWSYSELARDNVAVGHYAGEELETGSYCVFIGADSGNDAFQKADAINSIAIGANSYTTKSNQVVLGDILITETLIRGITGVNEVTIAAQLDVCQSNNAGAIPVLELDQDDQDESFINYVGTSAADQTKSISTINGDGAVTGPKNFSASAGWEYVGMVKIDINGSAYWMPYYQPDLA